MPAWSTVPPRDPEAIDILVDAYMTSGYDMRSVMRTLFLSDFFRSEQAYFAKVKNPTELVIGTSASDEGCWLPQAGPAGDSPWNAATWGKIC